MRFHYSRVSNSQLLFRSEVASAISISLSLVSDLLLWRYDLNRIWNAFIHEARNWPTNSGNTAVVTP